MLYWSIEIYSDNNHIKIFGKESKNNDLGKRHPIFLKYIKNPYNIDLWNIISEANRKYYENNNNKYLVYSCPFMCGGNYFYLTVFFCNN
jgi:hypothetical protein